MIDFVILSEGRKAEVEESRSFDSRSLAQDDN